jgi:DNA-binding NarL/FixJ family response regulator
MTSPSSHIVRLLVADRRPIAASGLLVAFEPLYGIAVSATCHEGRELSVKLGTCTGIEAVVIDVEMFEDDALRAVEAVRALRPAVAVLLLTTRLDEPLLEALADERVSCISAYSEVGAIVSALRSLVAGQTMLPADVQRALTQKLRRPSSSPNRRLTAREGQVLELAATGLTVSEIATSLYISHSTAKTHLLRVYEKLEAPNRSAAVATAVARGLLRLSDAAA